MSGTMKDIEGAFSVYVRISKQRELTEAEMTRVEYLVDRMNAQRQGARYRSRHMAQIREANARWRETNPEKVKEIGRRYHARHRGERNEQSREWYRRNHEKATARNRSRAIKVHLDDGGRALCGRSPAQGKRYEAVDDRARVTCGRCLQMIDGAMTGGGEHAQKNHEVS